MSYFIANIKIPLEIKADDSFDPMMDYISVEIEKCEKLPEKVDISIVQTNFFEQIKSLLLTQPSVIENEIKDENTNNELVFVPEELNKINTKNKKKFKNITFKNYSEKTKYRNTIKNHY
jgi:hypothetical protein